MLQAAAGDGRIDLEELDERLAATYAAKTYRDLEPVLADLPGVLLPPGMDVSSKGSAVVPTAAAMAPLPSRSLERVGGLPSSTAAIAVMGGSTRKGDWVVPQSFTAVAVMGGVELDLREARFEAAQVTITAIAFWGGVDITVGEDVRVTTDGVGIMGAFEGPHDHLDGPATVRVQVNGLAIMGGVEVKRKPPKPSKKPRRKPLDG